MSSADYIMKCSIAPPALVYIKEKTTRNAFTIAFEKVPVNDAERYLKNWRRRSHLTEADQTNARIYVRLSLGEGVDDLCTVQQASNMTFTELEGAGWTMTWSDANECFIVKPPVGFDFPDTYRTAFRSNAFYTSAKEGSTMLMAYIVDFPDVVNNIEPVDLYKRYPVKIEYFEAGSEKVSIGEKTTLSWRVLNAEKCYISGIGQVDTEDSREVVISEPVQFELSAENDMGMTEHTSLSVGCKKPTVKLTSDSKYYHKGGLITLYWESTSAASVQITPAPGFVPSPSGQMAIYPAANVYTAVANGYDGDKPYPAISALYLEETAWVNSGQITGVDLTQDTLNVDRRVWTYAGANYLFCNKVLYRSADLRTWEKVSELVLEPDMTLNDCSTVMAGTTFMVMGITKKDSNFIQTASYDFGEETWTLNPRVPNLLNLGGKMAGRNGQPYYGVLNKPLLMFYTPEAAMSENWAMPFYYKNLSMDAYDITTLRGTLYAAVHETTSGLIRISQYAFNTSGWIDIGTTDQTVSGWFAMIATKGIVYLLTKDWMINLDDLSPVSPFHPPLDSGDRPWTGCRNNTLFLITKEGVLWCYDD